MQQPDLSIIIVNWRSRDFVQRCLATLEANRSGMNYDIIVIDNASFDGTGELLASEFPDVTFIQSQENLGFARANNLAFAKSRGSKVLFLNPDTEIVGAAIQTLVATLDERPDAGMVGARLLNVDGTVQTSCVAAIPTFWNQVLDAQLLRAWFPSWRLWGMQALQGNSGLPKAVEAISGACMLGRRTALENIGVFSTDYFMYVEDMDLCAKLSRAGWAIYYVPAAVLIHHGGASSALRRESNFSNVVVRASLIRFFSLYKGRGYARLYRAALAVVAILRIVLLAFWSPVLIMQHGFSLGMAPLQKWFSILFWSLGLASWSEFRTRRTPLPCGDAQQAPGAPV